MGQRAKMSDRAFRGDLGLMDGILHASPGMILYTPDELIQAVMADASANAIYEARAILAETEPETKDGETWSLEAFTPGCFRYAFPGAVACGEAYILDAPAALADALRSFVEGC